MKVWKVTHPFGAEVGILSLLFTGISPVHGIVLFKLHSLHLLFDGVHVGWSLSLPRYFLYCYFNQWVELCKNKQKITSFLHKKYILKSQGRLIVLLLSTIKDFNSWAFYDPKKIVLYTLCSKNGSLLCQVSNFTFFKALKIICSSQFIVSSNKSNFEISWNFKLFN